MQGGRMGKGGGVNAKLTPQSWDRRQFELQKLGRVELGQRTSWSFQSAFSQLRQSFFLDRLWAPARPCVLCSGCMGLGLSRYLSLLRRSLTSRGLRTSLAHLHGTRQRSTTTKLLGVQSSLDTFYEFNDFSFIIMTLWMVTQGVKTMN